MNEYFIVSWNGFDEEIFYQEQYHWTPFLTDAKSFHLKEEAQKVASDFLGIDYEIKRY